MLGVRLFCFVLFVGGGGRDDVAGVGKGGKTVILPIGERVRVEVVLRERERGGGG